MADKSISGATTITNLAGTEKLPVAKAASVGDYNTTTQDILNIGTITTANAAASSNADGVKIPLTAGDGDGSGAGGAIYAFPGSGGATGDGGSFVFYGGTGLQHGGGFYAYGGVAARGGSVLLRSGNVTAAGTGSNVRLWVGSATAPDVDAPVLLITLGTASGTGKNGTLNVNNDPTFVAGCQKSWSAGEVLNGRTIYTATRAERVTAVIGRVDVANGGAATLVVVKCASGVVPGSGVALTSNSMNLAGTAATNQTLTLSTTGSDLQLAAGDSLVMVESGALGTSVGCITVHSTPQ